MSHKEIIYNESTSPNMSVQENIDFRRWQLHLYRTLYTLMEQGFSYENFLEKIKSLANLVCAKSDGYYVCIVNETADNIQLIFFPRPHQMARTVFEIRYEVI